MIRLASQLMGGNEPDPSNLRGLVINMAHASGVNAKKEDTSNAAASAAIIGTYPYGSFFFEPEPEQKHFFVWN